MLELVKKFNTHFCDVIMTSQSVGKLSIKSAYFCLTYTSYYNCLSTMSWLTDYWVSNCQAWLIHTRFVEYELLFKDGGFKLWKIPNFSNFRFSLILLLIRFRTEFKIIIQLSYFSFVDENLTNFGLGGLSFRSPNLTFLFILLWYYLIFMIIGDYVYEFKSILLSFNTLIFDCRWSCSVPVSVLLWKNRKLTFSTFCGNKTYKKEWYLTKNQ